jgi:hypothetical protein
VSRAAADGDDFKIHPTKSKAARNEIKAGRNKIKAGCNKIQIKPLSANRDFSNA